jgi:hypothetical protein
LPPLDHLAALSDNVGVVQHATESVPNRKTGYCTDDVARAFMVAVTYANLFPSDARSRSLASTYLAFLHHAQLENGRFHNFMDYDRRWADDGGGDDSCGRAWWALGYGVARAPTPQWRRVCAALLDRALPSLSTFAHLRSAAYASIGLSHAYAATEKKQYRDAIERLASPLHDAYEADAGPDWRWFEEAMYYDNARLPEAMLRASQALNRSDLREIGLESLDFYAQVTTENGVHVPIGNDGWYRHGGHRARYGQQPLEAAAMVDAQLAAFELTGKDAHLASAELALAWYSGKNSRGIVMAQEGGGCYDGLEENGPNYNMGAESTLAYLAATYAMGDRAANVAAR